VKNSWRNEAHARARPRDDSDDDDRVDDYDNAEDLICLLVSVEIVCN